MADGIKQKLFRYCDGTRYKANAFSFIAMANIVKPKFFLFIAMASYATPFLFFVCCDGRRCQTNAFSLIAMANDKKSNVLFRIAMANGIKPRICFLLGARTSRRPNSSAVACLLRRLNTHCLGGATASCSRLWHCSLVWGIGFAWSSFVAQESLLAVCSRSGLTSSLALARGHPRPDSHQLMFGLATGDVMIFF